MRSITPRHGVYPVSVAEGAPERQGPLTREEFEHAKTRLPGL
ncbi:hypothetical protein [Streptomyces sp. NPDC048623]